MILKREIEILFKRFVLFAISLTKFAFSFIPHKKITSPDDQLLSFAGLPSRVWGSVVFMWFAFCVYSVCYGTLEFFKTS